MDGQMIDIFVQDWGGVWVKCFLTSAKQFGLDFGAKKLLHFFGAGANHSTIGEAQIEFQNCSQNLASIL